MKECVLLYVVIAIQRVMDPGMNDRSFQKGMCVQSALGKEISIHQE